MVPTSFNESNFVLDAPPNMREACEPLSVLKANSNGMPVVVSCWKLTKEELEEVNKTGRVWLLVCGQTMPPCSLSGVKPDITSGP